MASIKTTFLGFLLATASATLTFSSAYAAIYKWVDAEGNVHYGEQPVSQDAERLQIKIREPVKPAASEDGKDADKETEDKDKKEEAKPEKTEPPKMSKKEKRARCKQAKGNLNTILTHGRLRERDKSGNSRYLTDEEKQRRLKTARKNVRKYCR